MELNNKVKQLVERGEYGLIKEALDMSAPDILKLYISEESIAEKIIPTRTVTMGDRDLFPDMELDSHGKSGDTFFVAGKIEQGRTAMEIDPRAAWKGDFVEGKYYKIRFGKIEVDPIIMQKLQLDYDPALLQMIKENSGEGIRRYQDGVFMRMVNEAISLNGNQYGNTSSDIIDMTTGYNPQHLVQAINQITDQEVDVDKILMSNSAVNFMSGVSAYEIGDKAGDMLFNGFNSDVLNGRKLVVTKKSMLADRERTSDLEHYFKTTLSDGKEFYHIYYFAPPENLGQIVKYGADTVESKWERDILSWFNWRYWGVGFGDIRGIGRLTIRVK